jgi:DNA-binding transcriptional regulator YiaG
MENLKANKKRIIATSRLTTSGLPAGGRKGKSSSLKSTTPVAIKAPHISLHFRNGVPQAIVKKISNEYSEWIDSIDDYETLVDWDSTELHKELSSQLTPGNTLATMRDAHGLTQAELCQKLNNDVSPKRISDWENGHRSISKEWAKRLSHEFKIPLEMFM